MLLVSGAMSTSNPNSPIIKIEGSMLHLDTLTGSVEPATGTQIREAVLKTTRIFKDQPTKLYPVLGQVYDSQTTTNPNLNIETIKEYINKDDWDNIVVVYQGSSDIHILRQLGITNHILDLRVYDVNQDGIFYIQLLNEKCVIAECSIDHVNKNGRLLNLREAHDLICDQQHDVTDAHNPCTDVIWTKCLFKYLMYALIP